MTSSIHRNGATIQHMDSALGSWVSARFAPAAESPLRGVAERIWYFDGVLADAGERVFPDGFAELVVMLDEPHRDGDTDRLVTFPPVCINGIRTRSSVVVAPHRRCRVLGIRFDPIGACRILRSSVNDLVDLTIDLQDALGRSAAELGERCAAAAGTFAWNDVRNAGEVIDAAIRWLDARIHRAQEADAAVRWSADLIRRAHGIVAVDELFSNVGVRRARLTQRFVESVGVTPKRFARIMRFHRALQALAGGETIAGTAADLAYYDQAHLYRDFSEFAGMTPGAYIDAKRYPGGVSLAVP
ncbi:MAG TPA: helix-turn-helix domain-containing protein [Candidatus Baltobacteraceae bacterium]